MKFAAECGQALAHFQKIPDKSMTGDAWWMKGQIHKNVYDDVQAAVEGQHTSPTPHLDFRLDFHYLDPPVNRHQITVRRPWAATHSLISRERADRLVASTAMGGAVKRIDYNAGWFDKLARWSQMLHHRLPEGGFNNHAIKQGRAAMQRNHELNPYSSPDWEKRVPGILKEHGANEIVCKDPIPQTGEGFLEEDKLDSSVFTLYVSRCRLLCIYMPAIDRSLSDCRYNHDPDYTCDVISVEEAQKGFQKIINRHRPVIIRNATVSQKSNPPPQLHSRKIYLCSERSRVLIGELAGSSFRLDGGGDDCAVGQRGVGMPSLTDWKCHY